MPYWSSAKTGVYHTCKNCTVGNNIESHNLRQGTPPPGAVQCQTCKDLEHQRNCAPGVPTPAR